MRILAIDPGNERSAYVNDERVPHRIWKKISVSENGCWNWTSSLHRLGYGDVWFDGKRRYAHRVMYVLLVGEVQPGMELDHLCRNRACCNPAHLEPVTHEENCRRGAGWTHNSDKTHCPRGHAYEQHGKSVERGDGRQYRRCKICHSENQQAYMVRSGRRA